MNINNKKISYIFFIICSFFSMINIAAQHIEIKIPVTVQTDAEERIFQECEALKNTIVDYHNNGKKLFILTCLLSVASICSGYVCYQDENKKGLSAETKEFFMRAMVGSIIPMPFVPLGFLFIEGHFYTKMKEHIEKIDNLLNSYEKEDKLTNKILGLTLLQLNQCFKFAPKDSLLRLTVFAVSVQKRITN